LEKSLGERGTEKSRSIKKQVQLRGTQHQPETRPRLSEKVKSRASLLKVWTRFIKEASGGVQVTCQVFQITVKIALQITNQVCVTDAFAILGDISPLKLYVNPTDMRCKIAIYYFHQCFSHSFSIELFLLPLKHPSLLHCHSGVYFSPLFILCLTLYSPLNNMYITSWCSSYQQFFAMDSL